VKKCLYILIGFIHICFFSKSQNNIFFIQYMDNQIYSNPAFTGIKERMNLNILYRQQWSDIDFSQGVSSFSFDSPSRYESIGFGLDFMKDYLGSINRTSFSGNFAYRIKFKNNHSVSLGLKTKLDSYSVNFITFDLF
jgi:type IX secretion system PorP/SprF family membrane protein